MRISTQQQYFRSIDQMQNSQSKLSELQNQISTGKRIQTPSDDPVAAAQVVKLERELAQYEKFDDNINVTERRLELEETILDDVNTAINRMRELTLNASNGTLHDQDRKTIANELTQITSYVAGLMNTQDSQGEYLFSGSQGGAKPYELENGRYQYQGDDGQRQMQVGSDLYIPSNDSGTYLFEAASDRLEVELTGQAVVDFNSGVSTVEPFARNVAFSTADVESAFSKVAKSEGWGDLTIRATASLSPAPLGEFDYTVVDSGGQVVNDELGNPIAISGDFSTTPGGLNIYGMQVEIHQPAVAGDIRLTVSTEKKNALDVAMDLAEVLSKPVESQAERDELNEIVATSLVQFTQASDRNNEAISTVGSRLRSLEQMSSSNLDFKLFTESALSTLVDADLASVISEFKLEEATLQAAQATFGRVSSLSLFNHIN
ncbi:flagellar hook-associated protein FlgL [Neptunomonas sp.]|uniref:flagellar hook-associated protein FlgL n=1 Tax=Neptunomonas sp. TaxID=1971898 RepID=UPI0025F01B7A|nr:flagellar hook-associated protein FlgL [Neptunomonas sp.]